MYIVAGGIKLLKEAKIKPDTINNNNNNIKWVTGEELCDLVYVILFWQGGGLD